MDVYNSEEEQIKALKDWWKENGTSIIVGIVLGVSGFAGYNWWKNHTITTEQTASNAFEEVIKLNPTEDFEQFVAKLSALKTEHASTGYALLASLHLSKQYIEREQFNEAESELRWAVDKTKGTDLQPLIQIRLARVLNAQARHEDAKALLMSVNAPAFAGTKQQVLGDTYMALGDNEAARTAYKEALAQTDSYSAKTDLELKINDLAEAPVASTVETSASQDS